MYGLGDGQMVNGVYVMSTPITTDTVLPSGTNVYSDASGVSISAPTSGGFAAWVNQNSTLVMVGAGVLVVLAMLSRGRR